MGAAGQHNTMSIHDLSISSGSLLGHWWLPGAPGTRLPGTISWSQAGNISLHLLGGFLPKSLYNVRTMHGELEDGSRATVIDPVVTCTIQGRSPLRAVSQDFLAFYALIGTPDHSDAECPIKEVSFSLRGLDSWIPIDQRTLDNGSYSHWQVASLPGEVALYLVVSESLGFADRRVRRTWWFSIRPHTPQTIRWFVERSLMLRQLVSLLVGVPCPYTGARALSPAEDEANAESSLLILPTEGDLSSRPDANRQTAAFPTISPRFGTILETWFQQAERLSAARLLFFDQILAVDTYSYPMFLATIQVIEGLVRAQPRQPNATQGAAISALIAAVQPILAAPEFVLLRQRANGLLGLLGDQSFRERLKAAIDQLNPQVVARYIPDQKAFIRDAGTVRNYLAHLLLSKPPTIFETPEAAVRIADRLRLLAFNLFLRAAGLHDWEYNLFGHFHGLTPVETSEPSR